MQVQKLREFSNSENNTWSQLFANLVDNRKQQAHPLFALGIEKLGLTGDHIPDLNLVNEKLFKLTGWTAVPVKGLEDGKSFFNGLAEKKFPIGNFIRSAEDLSYTPEPDIFHDLYGHIPFFADKDYADFNQNFGVVASKYVDDPKKLLLYERLYWFGLEFPLIETVQGRRIFGGGLLSSLGESNYSLSDKPNVLEFNLEKIADQDYRIDIFQETLFVLKKPQQLYSCLPEYEKIVNSKC
ncbi:MAG: hypothetical protein KDD40_02760 [Bdellovibrionales bacterium]|nr:hypothetical protein [Bdellovibrionales bacterium]